MKIRPSRQAVDDYLRYYSESRFTCQSSAARFENYLTAFVYGRMPAPLYVIIFVACAATFGNLIEGIAISIFGIAISVLGIAISVFGIAISVFGIAISVFGIAISVFGIAIPILEIAISILGIAIPKMEIVIPTILLAARSIRWPERGFV